MSAATEREIAAMRHAITLARRGLGSTSPNPIVGCVILDDAQRVVGEGFHRRAGGPHAEAAALRAAGVRARGGTAVATLEPCRHTGRTGPCTQALIEAGVTRVVYAVPDPSPRARGGADQLRSAGIEVVGGVLADEAARSNEAWLHFASTGRPFVTWKFAATLDGRTAAADGTSRWITGAAARDDAHRLRGEHDAVMVGSGTALVDDPSLTVRRGVLTSRQPLRVVVGRRELPSSAKVFDDAAPTLTVREHDPDLVLKELAGRDVVSVLLEGGATLAGAFMRAGRVDKVVAYLAPAFLGAGKSVLADAGITTISDILRWRVDDVEAVGRDLRLTARPTSVGE
jgi:diaminohydroxyphosphoribosylaminopyrimidine deaminase/5-amino-6-(5-phosphoribosylamino)uracil reductase